MSWNYRVIRHREPDGTSYYLVHEVHYDAHGHPRAMTERGATAGGQCLSEVLKDLALMQSALDKPPLDARQFEQPPAGLPTAKDGTTTQ